MYFDSQTGVQKWSQSEKFWKYFAIFTFSPGNNNASHSGKINIWSEKDWKNSPDDAQFYMFKCPSLTV